MIAPSTNAVCVPSTMLRIEMPLFSTVCLYKVELLSNIDTHVIPLFLTNEDIEAQKSQIPFLKAAIRILSQLAM